MRGTSQRLPELSRAHLERHRPDRCGTLEFVFRDDAGFEDYVEYALDVPMYFIYRNREPQDLTPAPGLTFRQFMERGMARRARDR